MNAGPKEQSLEQLSEWNFAKILRIIAKDFAATPAQSPAYADPQFCEYPIEIRRIRVSPYLLLIRDSTEICANRRASPNTKTTACSPCREVTAPGRPRALAVPVGGAEAREREQCLQLAKFCDQRCATLRAVTTAIEESEAEQRRAEQRERTGFGYGHGRQVAAGSILVRC